jgi:hypothetical protein
VFAILPPGIAGWRTVAALVAANPDIAAINMSRHDR